MLIADYWLIVQITKTKSSISRIIETFICCIYLAGFQFSAQLLYPASE